MKSISIYLTVLLLTFSFFSCKNDSTANSEVTSVEEGVPVIEKGVKKELTEADKKVIKSVMSKIMVTGELSTFSSALVTGGLTDRLAKEDGPYTVFAPSNEAFENLSETKRKELFNQANLAQLIQTLENHMAAGNLSSTLLGEKSTTNIAMLGGSQLVVFQKGVELWVKDKQGKEAKIVSSDLSGNNGVIHIIDQVLNEN